MIIGRTLRFGGDVTANLTSICIIGAIAFLLAVLIAMTPYAGIGVAGLLCLIVPILRMPEILLIAFAVALGVPYQFQAAGIPVNTADALLVFWLICLPAIVAFGGGGDRRFPFVIKVTLPFVLAVLLSVALASDPPGQYKQLLRIVEWLVLTPLVLSSLRSNTRLLSIGAVLLMLLPCLFAVDGVVEYFTNGTSISHMIGIPVPAPQDTSGETIHHTFDVSGRAGSTFGGAQGLALFIDLLLGVSFAHLIRSPSGALRTLACISLLICAAGLAVAQSRGGFIGAAAVVVAIACLEWPRLGRYLIPLAAISATASLFIIALWPGWDGTIAGLVPGNRADAVIDRLTIWRSAFSIWSDHPIFGVGLGNFRDHALARTLHLNVPLGYESFHAHNTYVEILVDTGVVGFICYVLFVTATLSILLRRWRSLAYDRQSHLATFVMASIGTLAAYAVFAAVDMLLLENTHMLLVLVLSFGLLTIPSPKRASA